MRRQSIPATFGEKGLQEGMTHSRLHLIQHQSDGPGRSRRARQAATFGQQRQHAPGQSRLPRLARVDSHLPPIPHLLTERSTDIAIGFKPTLESLIEVRLGFCEFLTLRKASVHWTGFSNGPIKVRETLVAPGRIGLKQAKYR